MKKALVALVLITVITFAWYKIQLRPVNASATTSVVVEIPTGTSVRGIAEILKKKQLIRSKGVFLFYVRRHADATKLKAGSYVLKESLSVPDILSVLDRGFSESAVVTIPEGYTIRNIDALLAERGLSRPGDMINCAATCNFSRFAFLQDLTGTRERPEARLEGYLFPDTYFVIPDTFTPQSFIERLLENFQKKVVEGLANDVKDSKRSLAEVITMASLVEEETRTDEERPTVAGILWKRLDEKTGLGVDASTRYGLIKPTGVLTAQDFEVDSAYNLRKYRGLPPTAIANPGIASITATLHPMASPYWYYLHGNDGKIHYAVTNDEHNLNRGKYLR